MVAPEYHGRGIGRALIGHCIVVAQKRGLATLRVESDPHALGFYRRMGATQIDAVPAPLPGLPERTLPIRYVFCRWVVRWRKRDTTMC